METEDNWEERAFEAREKLLTAGEDREKKIAFLKKWGKRIPPELLGPEAMHRGCAQSEMEPKPMLARRLSQRRILPYGDSPLSAGYVWVDDDGSCERTPERGEIPHHETHADWHVYRAYAKWAEAQYERFAIRCPRTLSQTESMRMIHVSEFPDWKLALAAKPAKAERPERNEEAW